MKGASKMVILSYAFFLAYGITLAVVLLIVGSRGKKKEGWEIGETKSH